MFKPVNGNLLVRECASSAFDGPPESSTDAPGSFFFSDDMKKNRELFKSYYEYVIVTAAIDCAQEFAEGDVIIAPSSAVKEMDECLFVNEKSVVAIKEKE